MNGTSVTCVLIGSQTAHSKWVKYEIEQSIEKQNGLIGIYIHNVKDRYGCTSRKGSRPLALPPFNFLSINPNSVYPCCSDYNWGDDNGYDNLGDWIEKAAQQARR